MSEPIPESLTTFDAARQAAVCLDVADRERFAEWFAEWHRSVTPAPATAAAEARHPAQRVAEAWLDDYIAHWQSLPHVSPDDARDLVWDLKDARARIRRLEEKARPRCAFCNWPVPLDVSDDEMRRQIAEHMLTCEGHPCAMLTQQLAQAWTLGGELLAALKRLNRAAFWRTDETDPGNRAEFEAATKQADELINRAGAAQAAATVEGAPDVPGAALWRSRCEIGWKSAKEFWVRWTGADFLYYWLHPTENRWVSEPEQITMPCFASRYDAEAALQTAPEPPALAPAASSQT